MTYSIKINYSSHIVNILDIIAYVIDYNYRNRLIRPSYALPWDKVNAMKIRITFSEHMPPFIGGVEKDVFLMMPSLVQKQMLTNKEIIHEELLKIAARVQNTAYFYTENEHQLIRALKSLPIAISKYIYTNITIKPQALDYYNKNFINMVKQLKFPKTRI